MLFLDRWSYGYKKAKRDVEMTQKLKALAAFADDQGSIPNTHTSSQKPVTPVLGDLMPSSDFHRAVHT